MFIYSDAGRYSYGPLKWSMRPWTCILKIWHFITKLKKFTWRWFMY